MTSLLSRAIAAVRVWMGLNDPAQNRLYPEHGWPLPASPDDRALALEKVLTLAPLAVAESARGNRR